MLCPIHGYVGAVRCSRDLHPSAEGAGELHDIVDLVYVVEDTAAWTYYLSVPFRAGVFYSDPGDWDRKLWCCCTKCFEAAHHGHIDDSFRWWPGPAQAPTPTVDSQQEV
jgi:hypothetical protein